MAWISVHESRNGPKLRNLRRKLGCSKWEASGILDDLWLWGLKNADREGYLICADEEDIELLLSGTESAGSHLNARDIVNALIETGWIDREEGKPLRLHDWEDWQKEWYKYQTRLKADRNSKRKKRAEEAAAKKFEESQIQAQTSPPEQEVLSIVAVQEKPAASKAKEYSEPFRKIYEIYPRKGDKAQAYKAYCARLKDGYSEDELYMATVKYAKKMKNERTEERYIKSAKTFFGSSTPFIDYISEDTQKIRETVQEGGNPFGEWGG